MRKLIVANIVSLDGYVAGPGDDVMAMPMDRLLQRAQRRAPARCGTCCRLVPRLTWASTLA